MNQRNSTGSHGRLISLFVIFVLSSGASPQSAVAIGGGYSLRFHGNGINDVDRVKIPIDDPARPADVGGDDFTIEFWMKAMPGENAAGDCSPGIDNWITATSCSVGKSLAPLTSATTALFYFVPGPCSR